MSDFDESERLIFEFFDGIKTRKVDPLVMRRRLLRASAGQLNDLLALARTDDPDSSPGRKVEREDAWEKCAAIFHEAFQMPPIDEATGEGFTEEAVSRVWMEWCNFVKKKDSNIKTTPTSTSSEAGNQPTTPKNVA